MSEHGSPTPPPSLAFVGSSSVELLSPLPAALASQLGLRRSAWVALGVRGSRLVQWTRPELPTGLRTLVVLLTANDARPTAARVREVDAALRRFATVVVWLPPLPYPADSRVAGRDALMRAALRGAGVVWVERDVRIEPGQWSPDRIHPTAAGFRAYARQVGPELAALVAAGPTVAPAVPSTFGVSEVGRVRTARGQWLPLTSLDAVWLARAVVGEGGTEADAYAVTSTMLRRWAMLRDADARSPFGSLTDLVVGRFTGPSPYDGVGREVALRGYSQPVAVQWRDPAVERRRRIRELPWEAIPPWRRTAVLRVLTGRAPLIAPGAVHFARGDVVAAGLARHPGWRRVAVDGARNEYISVAASRRRAEPVVVGIDGVLSPATSALRATRPPAPASPGTTRAPPSPSFVGPGLLVSVVGVGAVLALRQSSSGAGSGLDN